MTTVSFNVTILPPEERGGNCYADVHLKLFVAKGFDDLDSPEEYEVSGWKLCGYLARGASCDLDGSGLDVWGYGQPGGWRSCWGDGESSGRITVEFERDGALVLFGGDGCDAEYIDISGMGEADIVKLRDQIEDTLDNMDVTVPEPSPESVWHQLQPLGAVPFRVGSPWGAGNVVAVLDPDGDPVVYLEGEAWESAVGAAAVRSVNAEFRELHTRGG